MRHLAEIRISNSRSFTLVSLEGPECSRKKRILRRKVAVLFVKSKEELNPERGDGIEPRVSPRTRGHDARTRGHDARIKRTPKG